VRNGDEAKQRAGALIAELAPLARAGIPIVGLEPSCLLTLRDEALVMGLATTPARREPGAAVRGIRRAREPGPAASR
jgi:Fe-S oxidoreductase